MLIAQLLLELLFYLVVTFFAVYVLLELRIVFISSRAERRKLSPIEPSAASDAEPFLPPVTVLLPVYNEPYVIERLIEAVCRLRYPAGRLEILVLDDSTDSTTRIAQTLVAEHAAKGIDIRYLKRESREGFKAGNLCHGILNSTADFFAIFDADFIPPEDFLLKTLPCFKDPDLGFLQTGIGYENSDASYLTRFQAMEMGHQQFVTVGLSEDGNMASLSGSSCVWRRACFDEVGGWTSATATEDVDIGYRAQFGDWKYAYMKDVVSLSILPETISAFRIQRERWGRGLMQSAFKHVRLVLGKKMPWLKRLHALSMMFSSLLLASIYLLLLLSLPLALFVDFGGAFLWGAGGFFLLVGVWCINNAIGSYRSGRFARPRDVLRGLADFYIYVAMFLPMSWYYFAGGIRAMSGICEEFHRTPKGKEELRSAKPGLNRMLWRGDVFSFLYAACAVIAALCTGNILLIPLDLTACIAFGMVLRWSAKEASGKSDPSHVAKRGSSRRRILITGATGAIGGALAEHYAGQDIHLYLHGRDRQALDAVASRCEKLGARVDVFACDVRDTDTYTQRLQALSSEAPLDLAVLCAGMNANIGPEGEGEPPDAATAVVDINLKAVMAAVASLLPGMRARGRGQIALVSSLAGYFGLPVTPSYCASKAGVKAYGEALRNWLAPEGIKVSVIMPGYVASAMCEAMPGPKPFLLTPRKAAQTIRKGLERNRARIAFPFPLNLGAWCLAVLPAGLSGKIVLWLGYGR